MQQRHFARVAVLVLLAGCHAAPQPHEPSVRPGINESFLDPDLDIDEWTGRFEVESREIYVQREGLADATGLVAGEAVADVGAGTGLFLDLFAERVGSSGRVVALEISPVMVEHLRQRARQDGLDQVEVRLCPEDSVDLPEASLDVAFLCDVYHHLEYPRSTMTSIHRALRPDGRLVVVDFERIPGVSREWTLDHVRAGKQEVLEELRSFGFELEREVDVPGLEENYCLRLRPR